MDIATLLAAIQAGQRIGAPPTGLPAAMAAPEGMGVPGGPIQAPALQLLARAALSGAPPGALPAPLAIPKTLTPGLRPTAGPVPPLGAALAGPEGMGTPALPPQAMAIELLRRAAESAGPQVGPPALPPARQAGPPGPALPPGPPQVGPSPVTAWAGAQPSIGAGPGDSFGGAGRPPVQPAQPMDMATREMLARALQGPYAEGGGLVPMPGALSGGLPLPSLESFTKGVMGIPSDEPQKVEVTAADNKKPSGVDALAALTAQFGAKPAGPTTMTVDPWTGKVETRMPTGWPGLPGGPAPAGNIPIGSGIGAAPTTFNLDGYVSKMYGSESGSPTGRMVPNAAGASSAFGPAQFTKGTWLDTVREYDKETWNALGGDSGKVLALRKDPTYHDTMARAFSAGNARTVSDLGLTPTDANVYTMHFFGRGDGPKVLTANPDTPLADVVQPATIGANPQLKGMTVGQAREWADQTINKNTPPQGSSPGGLPVAPNIQAAQLPTPPTVQALKTADPAAYDKYDTLKVVRPDPMAFGDRLTNILATMAQGGQGTKTIGDFLLGAGGGALSGAAGLAKQARAEDLAAAGKQQELDILKAGIGVQKAGAVANAANAGIQAANQTAQNQFQRDLQQSELDAAAKNKTLELQHHVNLAGWQEGKPQVMPGKDGEVHIVVRDPNTQKISFTTIPATGENSMLTQLKKQSDNLKSLFGDKATHLLDPVLAQMAFAKGMQMTGSPEGGRLAVLHEGVNQAAQSGVLQQALSTADPKMWAALDKEVNAGLPLGTLGTPKGTEEYRKILAQTVIGKMGQDPRWAKLVTDGVLKHAGVQAGPGVYFGLHRALGGQ